MFSSHLVLHFAQSTLFYKAYTGPMFEVAPYTLLSYSIVSPWGECPENLSIWIIIRRAPRSLSPAEGEMWQLGSLPGGWQAASFSHPAPTTPLWPGPHCLWLRGYSSQLVEKHVTI